MKCIDHWRERMFAAMILSLILGPQPTHGQHAEINELFEVSNPFPNNDAINALRECYPTIPVEQAQRLKALRYIGYRERSATNEETASSTCTSRRLQTFVSERVVDLTLDELSSQRFNALVAPQAKNDCEERRWFGEFTVSEASTSAVSFTTEARYRTRSCGFFGKNNKYVWHGALTVRFTLDPVYAQPCTAGATDCRFLGHRFLPPQVSTTTYYEKAYWWNALLDDKALIGALVGGLVAGPAGLAAGATLGTLIAVAEIDATEGMPEAAAKAGSAEVSAIVKKLIDEDIMSALSRSVARVAREVEAIQIGYSLSPAQTGFKIDGGSVALYSFHELGSYCSNTLSAVLKQRQNTTALFNRFASCGETTITVAAGDRLWDIAKRTIGDGYAFLFLAARNGLKESDRLVPGTKLIVPSPCELCKHRNNKELALRGSTLERIVKSRGLPAAATKCVRTVSGDPNIIYPYEIFSFSDATIRSTLLDSMCGGRLLTNESQ